MLWEDLRAPQYICNTADLKLICEEGIWCRNRVERSNLHPTQLADGGVVARRRTKQLSDRQTWLLDCVNLYFNARNAMLYARREQWPEIVVLDIDKQVLRVPGVRVTLQNAAIGDAVRDTSVDYGLALLEASEVYRVNWNHEDPNVKESRKNKLQAEVLVPKWVHPKWLLRGRVVDGDALGRVQVSGVALPLEVDCDLFFGGSG